MPHNCKTCARQGQTIEGLSADELARFREWFDEFDAEVWDRQFAEDAKSGN